VSDERGSRGGPDDIVPGSREDKLGLANLGVGFATIGNSYRELARECGRFTRSGLVLRLLALQVQLRTSIRAAKEALALVDEEIEALRLEVTREE
jgi:hypothetical protein